MAVYKVIQDVEAEDKLLGPLTLKQFIFAVIAAGFVFAAYLLVKSVGVIYAAIPFVPFILFFGTLAAPLGKDQPTDIWLAAKIRFLLLPRVRVWDQNGMKQLVKITVPRKEVKNLTDNLEQSEVKSRLNALADTLDSRGWAVKNVSINMYDNPAYSYAYDGGNERLLDPISLPMSNQRSIITETTFDNDVLDAENNQDAQRLATLVDESTIANKRAAVEKMQQAIEKQKTLTYQPPAQNITTPDITHRDVSNIEQTTTASEIKATKKQTTPPSIAEQEARRAVELAEQAIEAEKSTKLVKSKPETAIIKELAESKDLSVATLASLADSTQKKPNLEDGFTIKLR